MLNEAYYQRQAEDAEVPQTNLLVCTTISVSVQLQEDSMLVVQQFRTSNASSVCGAAGDNNVFTGRRLL